jgi:hypothetical protein
MRSWRVWIVAISLVAAAWGTRAGACIGPPAPDLWDLIHGADAIVVAEVVRVAPDPWHELLGEPIPDLQDRCGLARAELLRRHWSAAMEKHFPGLDLELMRRRLAAEEEWRRAMLDEIQTVYAR